MCTKIIVFILICSAFAMNTSCNFDGSEKKIKHKASVINISTNDELKQKKAELRAQILLLFQKTCRLGDNVETKEAGIAWSHNLYCLGALVVKISDFEGLSRITEDFNIVKEDMRHYDELIKLSINNKK